jgi:hypothetical protein
LIEAIRAMTVRYLDTRGAATAGIAAYQRLSRIAKRQGARWSLVRTIGMGMRQEPLAQIEERQVRMQLAERIGIKSGQRRKV